MLEKIWQNLLFCEVTNGCKRYKFANIPNKYVQVISVVKAMYKK